MLVALLIAAVGLGACVIRTRPVHRHPHVQSHEKQEKHEKHKHKKHKH